VAEQRTSGASSDARVSTGHPPLDAMLEGGLVAHRPYLIVGPAGTGKTTLALQFLCEGARLGERCLLVTLEEPPNEVRLNHRTLGPELSRVEVFDAIPDVMRYERVPFKDIASVREVIPFDQVPEVIRKTPELSGVEVTITALEQMLRSEVHKKKYTRLVIDSLTALEYFCMKGFDPISGAQSFLRFLADLRTTTILTVESPLEDTDTPERMLARGEIRLFRWELDGRTVRAIGVEKFRGSSHDVRLHPYRIGPQGLDVKLDVTISRDTRQILEPTVAVVLPSLAAAVSAAPPVTLAPLSEAVRDLRIVGAEVAPIREEVNAALEAVRAGRLGELEGRVGRISGLTIALAEGRIEPPPPPTSLSPELAAAFRRIAQRAEAARGGVPPTRLPDPHLLEEQLTAVLSLLTAPPEVAPPPPAPPPAPTLVAPPAAARTEPAPSPPPAAAVPPPPAPPPPAALEPRANPPAAPAPVLPPAAPPPSPASPRMPEPPPLPSALPPTVTTPSSALGHAETTVSSPGRRSPQKTPGGVVGTISGPSPPPMPSVGPPAIPSPAAASPEPPAPPAKRTRRASPRKPTAAAEPAAGAAVAKPRKRTVRKRRAPTVVAASAETTPPPSAEEPPAAAPAPHPSPPSVPDAAEPKPPEPGAP
jgi:KaiC/GvpD/RAD55 family RecA-like ATPase